MKRKQKCNELKEMSERKYRTIFAPGWLYKIIHNNNITKYRFRGVKPPNNVAKVLLFI